MLRELVPTTEADHLRDLADVLRLMVSQSRDIAASPVQGVVYEQFVAAIRRAEYLCSRIVYDRADGRWSAVPLTLAQIHTQAGGWLRGHAPRDRFLMLADMLEALERHVSDLRHKATGRIGAIVARPLRGADRTTGRAVQVLAGEKLTRGGLILPAGVAA